MMALRWKYIGIIVFVFHFMPSSVLGLPSENAELNSLFDRIIQASSLESCEKIEKALADIPDADIERVRDDLHDIHSGESLAILRQKIDQMTADMAHCPKVQDKFANRLSRLMAKESVRSAVSGAERARHIDVLRQFTLAADSAIDVSSCHTSGENLKKTISRDLCAKALEALRAVPANELSPEEHVQIADTLEKILKYAETCSEYQQAYRHCLYPDLDHGVNSVNLRDIQPFIAWLDALQNAVHAGNCDAIQASIKRIDPALREEAKKSVATVKPAQFSESDRQAIQARMKSIYSAGKSCRQVIDDAIESLF